MCNWDLFLRPGSFVIIRNESKRTYIGEVLDLYKLAAGNRYGSVRVANSISELKYLSVRVWLPLTLVSSLYLTSSKSSNVAYQQHASEGDVEDSSMSDVESKDAPLFSCRHKSCSVKLHTHERSDDVLYHVGREAFVPSDRHSKELNLLAAKHWIELTKPTAVVKLPNLKLKIPGRKKK